MFIDQKYDNIITCKYLSLKIKWKFTYREALATFFLGEAFDIPDTPGESSLISTSLLLLLFHFPSNTLSTKYIRNWCQHMTKKKHQTQFLHKQATYDSIIWHICFACWITKDTRTHSEYVILLAFAQQQLCECTSSYLQVDCPSS